MRTALKNMSAVFLSFFFPALLYNKSVHPLVHLVVEHLHCSRGSSWWTLKKRNLYMILLNAGAVSAASDGELVCVSVHIHSKQLLIFLKSLDPLCCFMLFSEARGRKRNRLSPRLRWSPSVLREKNGAIPEDTDLICQNPPPQLPTCPISPFVLLLGAWNINIFLHI